MLQTQDFFSAFDRSFAWGLYLGATAVALAIMVWITQRWQRNLRWLLLGLLLVVALMPAPIPNHGVQAPAFVFLAFGLLTRDADMMAPVLVRYALAGAVLVLLVVVEGVWWQARQRRAMRVRQNAARKRSKP